MNQRSRLLVYERKEVVLLGILSILVALFAFTFGIHLGKRVPPKSRPAAAEGSAAGWVNPISDQAPTRAEAQDKVPEAATGAAEAADRELEAEVERTGIHLDKPIPVDLPATTVGEKMAGKDSADSERKASPESAATAESRTAPESAPAVGSRSADGLAEALARPAPAGAFALQVFAAPVGQSASLEASIARLTRAGIEPWAREVEIPGKGTWIRLQVGGFDTRDSARKRAIAWKAAGAIEGFVVVRSSVGQKVADESADHGNAVPNQQHPGEKP